jgi:Pyruvate/2-oxoacid:ferredoxin oxidoreductase delta subunit
MGFVKGEKHITVDDCKGSEICPNVQECLEKVYQQEVN